MGAPITFLGGRGRDVGLLALSISPSYEENITA